MPFDVSTGSDRKPCALPLEFVEPSGKGMTGVVAQIAPQENINVRKPV
jgi:hypothetical protein